MPRICLFIASVLFVGTAHGADDADAKPRSILGFAAPQRVNLASQCLVSRYGQVEAFTETVGVQA